MSSHVINMSPTCRHQRQTCQHVINMSSTCRHQRQACQHVTDMSTCRYVTNMTPSKADMSTCHLHVNMSSTCRQHVINMSSTCRHQRQTCHQHVTMSTCRQHVINMSSACHQHVVIKGRHVINMSTCHQHVNMSPTCHQHVNMSPTCHQHVVIQCKHGVIMAGRRDRSGKKWAKWGLGVPLWQPGVTGSLGHLTSDTNSKQTTSVVITPSPPRSSPKQQKDTSKNHK
jgi:hypothetical protein